MTELYLLPCGRKRAALVPGSIAIIVDLHKNFLSSDGLRWGKGDLTSQAGKGGPLVITDRKPKLWLLVLWNVGGAIALI